MKHLFLPHNLSLIAKEKGFDKPCLAHYKKEHNWKLIPNSQLVSEMDASMFPDEGKNGIEVDVCKLMYNHNKNTYINWIAAPLYQQIIDWFRVEHNVCIAINGKKFIEYEEYFYMITKGEGFQSHIEPKYNDYYICLDKAIEQAFNYINNKKK